MGKPLGHDQFDHFYGATSLDTVTIKNHKSSSKFDSEISVARNVISVIGHLKSINRSYSNIFIGEFDKEENNPKTHVVKCKCTWNWLWY